MVNTPKTVLIIEDSPVQAASVGHMLQQNGLRVLYATEGSQGVLVAQQHQPDAIIVDLEMPGMNGLEVCSRLRRARETRRIPIIMLSRHSDPELVTLGLQSGIIDYIPKDAFSDAVLLETLRQMGLVTPSTAEP
jgi:PleD family two-component response regulator